MNKNGWAEVLIAVFTSTEKWFLLVVTERFKFNYFQFTFIQGRISYCRLMNFNQINGQHILELGGVFLLFKGCSHIPLFGFDVCSQKPWGCDIQNKNNKDIKVSVLLSRTK
jgi:hypothetical protein